MAEIIDLDLSEFEYLFKTKDETEEEKKERLRQEALEKQLESLKEDSDEEVVQEGQEIEPQVIEEEEIPVTVEESTIDLSEFGYLTKPVSKRVPEDEPTWERKVAYGFAQEPTIAGSLARLGKAKLLSLFSEKSYSEIAKEIENARQEKILEEFSEFRGREEDAAVIVGRVGMAVADPVTLFLPWIKIAKLGKISQMAIGAGISMGDIALREEALFGEIDPKMVGIAGVLGAGSTAIGVAIQSRFSKKGGRSGRINETTEVVDASGNIKSIPTKIDGIPTIKPPTPDETTKLLKAGNEVEADMVNELASIVGDSKAYGKATTEIEVLRADRLLATEERRKWTKRSKLKKTEKEKFLAARDAIPSRESLYIMHPTVTEDLNLLASAAKTRISRKTISQPIKYLSENANIKSSYKILHQGAGDLKNPDVPFLDKSFKSVTHYDTTGTFTKAETKLGKQNFDVVISPYVLNTIPYSIRKQAIIDAATSLKPNGSAYFAVRASDVDKAAAKSLSSKNPWTEYKDGWITARGTFQKGYTGDELIADLQTIPLFKEYNIIKDTSGMVIVEARVAPKAPKITKKMESATSAQIELLKVNNKISRLSQQEKQLQKEATILYTDKLPSNIAAIGKSSIKRAQENGTLTENFARGLQYELVRPIIGGIGGGILGLVTDEDEDNLFTHHLLGFIAAGVILGSVQKYIQRSSPELKQPLSNKIKRIFDEERDIILKHKLNTTLKAVTAGTHRTFLSAEIPPVQQWAFKTYRDQGSSLNIGKSVINMPVEQSVQRVISLFRKNLHGIFKDADLEDIVAAGRISNQRNMPKNSLHSFLKEGDLENSTAQNLSSKFDSLMERFYKYAQDAGTPMQKEDAFGFSQILHPNSYNKLNKLQLDAQEAFRIQTKNWKGKERFGKVYKGVKDKDLPITAEQYVSGLSTVRTQSIWNKKNIKTEGAPLFVGREGMEEDYFMHVAGNLSRERVLFDQEARAFMANQGHYVNDPVLSFQQMLKNSVKVVELTRKNGAKGEGIQKLFKQNRAWYTEEARKKGLLINGKLPVSMEKLLDKSNQRVMDSLDAFMGVYQAGAKVNNDLARTSVLYGQAVLATTKLEKVVIPSLGDLAQVMQNSGFLPFAQAEIKQIQKLLRQDRVRPSKELALNLYTKDAGLIDKTIGWKRNRRYDDMALSSEMSAMFLDAPNVGPIEWMRRFFEFVQLGRITRHAREVAYDAGIIKLYRIGRKLNKRGDKRIPDGVQAELTQLGITAKQAKYVAKFKSADNAYETDKIAKRIMDRAGINASDRDALVPTWSNRRLFAQSQNPFIRLLGSFLSWAQAKSTQTNALITRLEHGDHALAVRMMAIFPVYASVNWLRMNFVSSDQFREEYLTDPTRAKNMGEVGLFKAEYLPWYGDKLFNSGRHMGGIGTPTDAVYPISGLLTDLARSGIKASEGDFDAAAVDAFETLIPFGEDISSYTGWKEQTRKEAEQEKLRYNPDDPRRPGSRSRKRVNPGKNDPRRPGQFQGGAISKDHPVPNAPVVPMERKDRLGTQSYAVQASAEPINPFTGEPYTAIYKR